MCSLPHQKMGDPAENPEVYESQIYESWFGFSPRTLNSTILNYISPIFHALSNK